MKQYWSWQSSML